VNRRRACSARRWSRSRSLIAHLKTLVGAVALFSHGQFARVLAARSVSMAVGDGRRFALDPASISTLGFEHDDPDRPVIALWNAAPGARGGVPAARYGGHRNPPRGLGSPSRTRNLHAYVRHRTEKRADRANHGPGHHQRG